MIIGPEGPGYRFIQQYEHGLPTGRKDLAQCVDAYVEFLLDASGQEDLPPVELEPIYDQFSLQAKEGDFKEASLGIEGANLAEMGMIVFDSSDIQTRQRFTQAHELLECLIVALEGNRYSSTLEPYFEGKKKERLCNWGAARLLMPKDLFQKSIREHGIGIDAAERIARVFKTSRLATLRHMVNCYPKRCGLIIWKRAHKPTESVPSPNQAELWDDLEGTGGPQKEVRVQWKDLGRKARKEVYVPEDKSVDSDSLIARALEEGEAKSGRERVELGDLKGTFEIEAVPFTAGDDPHVLSLFHWPAEMFAGQEAQSGFSGTH
ncbi:ImmA/IrrE family metallo-endopeptidase [Salinibacter sp.]|uniref:ImmA/IrrE family metallo-endopeptidase n=1 Tax=Salinibacter sp. TaxID=2065818 RepID=UPI0021E98107|nr:ImmA/IrrE family metallo-endopeptidase [Salinibacter sp.]